MSEHIKVNTGVHEAQEPHDAANCKINEALHNHPDTDCGHFVPYGPATGIPAPGNEAENPDGTKGDTGYVPYGPATGVPSPGNENPTGGPGAK